MVEVAHGLGDQADKTNQYGTWGNVYYNWCAAVGLTTTCNTTEQQDRSICPKGWTLPTNGDVNTNKSWTKLLDTYSINTGPQLVSNNTLGYTKYYGVWTGNLSSEWIQGMYGVFWTSTPDDAAKAYSLAYASDGRLDPHNRDGKGGGFSIRCVAR